MWTKSEVIRATPRHLEPVNHLDLIFIPLHLPIVNSICLNSGWEKEYILSAFGTSTVATVGLYDECPMIYDEELYKLELSGLIGMWYRSDRLTRN